RDRARHLGSTRAIEVGNRNAVVTAFESGELRAHLLGRRCRPRGWRRHGARSISQLLSALDGQKNHAGRNEPGFLPHVLAAVARAAGRPAQMVAEQTTRTAYAFFGIDRGITQS